MTMMTGPGAGRGPAENDVYTALLAIAFLFALTATIYVGYRSQVLFGTLIPFGGS